MMPLKIINTSPISYRLYIAYLVFIAVLRRIIANKMILALFFIVLCVYGMTHYYTKMCFRVKSCKSYYIIMLLVYCYRKIRWADTQNCISSVPLIFQYLTIIRITVRTIRTRTNDIFINYFKVWGVVNNYISFDGYQIIKIFYSDY